MQRLIFLWTAAILLLIASGCENLPLDAAVQAENGLSEESAFALRLSPKSGKISIVGNDGNIYTLNQAGNNINPVTADANLGARTDQQRSPNLINYLLPTWSTSGQQLAYVRLQVTTQGDEDFAQSAKIQTISFAQQQRRPEQKTTFTIFVLDRANGAPKSIWSGSARPIYMSWSPNGEYVSALLQQGNSPALQLALIATADSSINVVDVGSPLFWDWAPNSQQIMTHIGSGEVNERISVLELSEPVTEEIINLETSGFMSPDVSPNGRQFALPIKPDEEDDDDF